MNGLDSNAAGRARTALFAVLVLVAGPGCSGLGARDGTGDDDTVRIARNLVYTLVQLEETNPLTTTVQVSEPATPFGREVVRLIREAGYGLQSVPDDRGANYLRYRVSSTDSELGSETRYAVSIGDVRVERAFAEADGALVPITAQRVEGSTATSIELDDAPFDVEPDPATGRVVFDDELEPAFTDASGVAVLEAELAAAAAGDFGARVKQNLYGGLSSNYADLFAAYDDVSSASLTFGNDSMRLGDEQKAVVERFAAELRPETDLLSVIGCSHGSTAIRNGNGLLALGRANRVKEALVFAGVPPGVVLDEGCWAGSGHEYFPERGVVITLKRRVG